jgi:ParB family chromosome partitioning protein
MSNIVGDSVFWIETEKIHPNPYQPRREFNEAALKDLSDSIRMYGVLQPLVVTRQESTKEDGGIVVEYELISGERRLRASRLAGLQTVPAIIRSDAQDARLKLELAIIENLQREDLNPVDRARSFERLVTEFDMKHVQVAVKIGKSREYVSNSLRLLNLPEYVLDALTQGKITEGHARPLMMLAERPDEQSTLFKEIVFKKLTVRETEGIARRIAVEKIRKVERKFDPEIVELENKISQSLGTRVAIEHKQNGGKITISFFSDDDLKSLLNMMTTKREQLTVNDSQLPVKEGESMITDSATPIDDRPPEEQKADEDDGELYSLKNFTV